MEKKTNSVVKCVDVSSYQGNINWSFVKSAGVNHAILKVIRKDLNPDTSFERNWNGCNSAGVAVDGVYNYSYATTVTKAKTDAQKVLSILNGRKCTIWLDVEDKCQQGLGVRLKDIINTYRDVIVGAGYDFGIYTGMSFYNSYIKPYEEQIKCNNFWIARYYNSATKMAASINPNEQYNPKSSIGRDIFAWQYTSSGQVSGINGNVDLSVIYGDHVIAAKGKVSNCTKLNMRKEPIVEKNNIVDVLDLNDEVYLLKIADNGWYKVKTKDNLVGYVSNKYIMIL